MRNRLTAAASAALLLVAVPAFAEFTTKPAAPAPASAAAVPAAAPAAPASAAPGAIPSTAAATPGGQTAPSRGGAATGGYASEADAKSHCAGDTVVWGNPTSQAYRLPGEARYGKTKRGEYLCQKAADAAGMHHAGKNAARAGTTKKG